MVDRQLRVTIVGGGIAGLCLAQALKQAGVAVAVYERDRSRTDRLEGFRLHINPAGTRALHACLPTDLWRRFVSTAGESASLGFLSQRLRELLVIRDTSTRADTPEPERAFAADRVTLREVLLDGLDDIVHFDKTFTHYQVTGDTVTAFFADGTQAGGDVLVGADGANSRLRRQYLPQAERVDTGALGIACRLPLTPASRAWLPPRLARAMNMIIAPAPYFLFTSAFDPQQPTVHPDRDYTSYVLCAFVARPRAYPPDVEQLDQGALKRVLESRIARWHPVLRRLIAEADPTSFMLVQHLASAPVPAWPSTRVTLVGDAIHSMPPVGGLGGNAALRDAHLLGRALVGAMRSGSPISSAIRRYETDMRAYGFEAVTIARQAQEQGLRSDPFVVAGQRLWFRLGRLFPALMLKNLPYADWARPRAWEHEPVPWAGVRPASPRERVA